MKLLIALALLAPACGVDPPDFWAPPERLSWEMDPSCMAPNYPQARAIEWGATELWRMVGVHTERAEDGEWPDVWICMRSGQPRPGYGGWQSWREDGSALVEVAAIILDERLGAVVAHEIGHAILPGTGDANHLPPGQVGILAAHVEGTTWSADDEAFLATFGGFIPVVRAH